MTDWKPLQRQRTYEYVIDAVESKILAGELSTGDRLPPERQLAEVLGVSRPSVREAFRVLESMGVVEAAAGSGQHAGSFIAATPAGALSRLLRVHVALSSFEMEDVLEARLALEVAAVRLAAVRAGEDDLATLDRLVERMGDVAAADPAVFNELDTAFHVGIAHCSGNRVLGELMQAIREAVRREMVRAFDRLPDPTAAAGRLVGEHADLLAAMRRRDADEAAAAVTRHIEGFYAAAFATEHRS